MNNDITTTSNSTNSSILELTSRQSSIREVINNNNNNNNISDSLNEAQSSSIPSRQHHLQQIQVPEWQPDESAENCSLCGKKFTFWIRKHHCRKCGHVICNSCSLNEITYLPSTYVVCPPSQIFLESPHVPHRTCDACFEEVEMIRNALSDSLLLLLLLDNQTGPLNSLSTNSSTKDLSTSRTVEVPNNVPSNNRLNDDEDSFKDRCPVCNKFIGCFAEEQKEEHINACLVNLEFSGSPQQQRTNNRMLVYKIPQSSITDAITIPSIDNTIGNNNSINYNNNDNRSNFQETRAPSTSMDTLTSSNPLVAIDDGSHLLEPINSSVRSSNSTLETSEEKKDVETECVICFEDFKPGDKVARMECLCVFHYDCIRDWFKKKGDRECPVHTLHYNN